MAAIRLARAGHRVTLIEKARVPRDKICGDGLIPDSLNVIESLGLLDVVKAAGHPAQALRFHAPNGKWFDVPQRLLCVRRERLDAILAEAAVAAGARLRDGTEVTGFTADARGAALTLVRGESSRAGGTGSGGGVAGDASGEGATETLRAQLVVLACGAASDVLRRFGLEHRATPSAIAARAYYRLAPSVAEDTLHIWYERSVLPGYAWAFPMGGHVFNVGVGAFHDTGAARPNLRAVFERLSTDVPTAREMLQGGEALAPMVGAPLRTRLHGCAFAAERLLVAGEALGTTYSFTGEGIGKAMETGVLAADHCSAALEQGRFGAADLRPYATEVRTRLAERFSPYLTAQKWLRFPAVMNLVAARARRSEGLRARFTAILGEEIEPTAVFSLKGLVRTLFS